MKKEIKVLLTLLFVSIFSTLPLLDVLLIRYLNLQGGEQIAVIVPTIFIDIGIIVIIGIIWKKN